MTADQITSVPNTGASRRSHSIIPDNGDDYVLGGCALSYNGSRLIVSAGTLTIADGGSVYAVQVDERVIQSPASGGVWYSITDASANAGELVVGSTPSAPRLKLGSVDTSAGTTSEANRAPSQSFGALDTGKANITESRVIRAEGANGNWVETFYPEDYSSDHEALNAARDAIKSNSQGGTLTLGLGTFDLEGPFRLDNSGIALEGQWLRQVAPESDPDDIDDVAEVSGSTLRQTKAGSNIIEVQHELDGYTLFSIGIENLNLTWKESIRRNDTGHGIKTIPYSGDTRAAQGLIVDNVQIHGQDGNHFGLDITNVQGLRVDNIRTEGGGGMRHESIQGAATGNAHVGFIYSVVDVTDGTAPIFEISGNINFVRYDYLQVFAKQNVRDNPRNAQSWVISPNGNVGEVQFGVLDNETYGSHNGVTVGAMDKMWSSGIGVSNPIGQAVVTRMDYVKLHDGNNPNFSAFAIEANESKSPNPDWQITRSGAKVWDTAVKTGDVNSPTTAGTSSPGPSIPTGKAVLRLPDPGVSVSAGDTITYYTNWGLLDAFGFTGSTLKMDLMTTNGNGMAVQLASNNNHSNVPGEIQIDAYALEADPFPVELTAEISIE